MTAVGLFWVTNVAADVKDAVEVCAKDASIGRDTSTERFLAQGFAVHRHAASRQPVGASFS